MSEASSMKQVFARRTIQESIIDAHRSSGRGIVDLWRYYGESAEDAGEDAARKFLLAVGAADFDALRQLGAVVGPSGPVNRFNGMAADMIKRYNLAACWMDCVNTDDGTVDEDLVVGAISSALQASMPWTQTMKWLRADKSEWWTSSEVHDALEHCVTLMIEEYDGSLWNVFCNTVPRSDLFVGIVSDAELRKYIPDLLNKIWALGNSPSGNDGTVSMPAMRSTMAHSIHEQLDDILRCYFTIAELVRFAPVDKIWKFLLEVFQMFVNEGDEVFGVLAEQAVALGGDGDGVAEADVDVLGDDEDGAVATMTPSDSEPVRVSVVPAEDEAEATTTHDV